MRHKKSQVASTMVWFIATVIIFFIMILFLTASVLNSGRKKVSVGFDEVNLVKYDTSLRSQSVLFNLLNTVIKLDNEEKSLKEWLSLGISNLEEGKKAELKENFRVLIKKNIDSNKKECYVFSSFLTSEKDFDSLKNWKNLKLRGPLLAIYDKNSLRVAGDSYEDNDLMGMSGEEKTNDKLLRRATNLVLISQKSSLGENKNNFIVIKFYIGDC